MGQKLAKKLLDQVREIIRMKHYSPRTEKAYVGWIRRDILYHNKRHPSEMGAREIEIYLSHLATERRVAASTQNPAFNAILFLYKSVLGIELDEKINAVRAKVQIAGQEKKCPVESGSKGVVFEMDLPAGPTELRTYFLDQKDRFGGAFFTEVEAL